MQPQALLIFNFNSEEVPWKAYSRPERDTPTDAASMASNSRAPDSALASYPATTRQAAGVVDGIPTEVTSVMFADKIMVTITQEGRLAQWVKAFLYLR